MAFLERLKALTAWDSEPVLTEDDLAQALAAAALTDAAGLEPLNEEWSPTYDLNAAAAQGWLLKAAKAASIVDEPSAGAVTSKVFDNCRKMAGLYAAKRTFAARIK